MKQVYLFLLAACTFAFAQVHAQTVCDTSGNVIMYSNYDGGVLNIDVDVDIPNLKIGVVSYEPVTINISGTYVANVTGVIYAGYVSTTNMHCNNSPTTTTINGVPSNITAINFLPAATYNNPNGYTMIVCNYSCSSTTNQGGCNTPDQVADYFLTNFGGTMRYHFTQYGCWSNTMPVSAGGNCCEMPITTGVHENGLAYQLTVSPNPSNGNFRATLPLGNTAKEIEIVNALGETVKIVPVNTAANATEISLEGQAAGIYFLRLAGSSVSTKILLTE